MDMYIHYQALYLSDSVALQCCCNYTADMAKLGECNSDTRTIKLTFSSVLRTIYIVPKPGRKNYVQFAIT